MRNATNIILRISIDTKHVYHCFSYALYNVYQKIKPFENLQNAFAMATLPIIEINGTMIIPVPKFLHISTKVSVWFPTFLEKDGGSMEGSPESIWPVRMKGAPPRFSKMYDATAHRITTRAFLPVPRNQINFLKIRFETLASLSFWNEKKIQIRKKVARVRTSTSVSFFSSLVCLFPFLFLRIHSAWERFAR